MQTHSPLTGIVIVLTAVCLVVGAAAAHDENTLPRPDQRRSGPTLNVVATLEHYGAIAKVIGGDRVKVSVIVKGSQNPHTIAVKPSYSVLFNKADVLVANGQLIELGWLDVALINARNAKIQEGHPGFVNCSIGVDIISYSADEIEGTPFFILNLGVGGTLRLDIPGHNAPEMRATTTTGSTRATRRSSAETSRRSWPRSTCPTRRTIEATRNTLPCISARNSRNGTS